MTEALSAPHRPTTRQPRHASAHVAPHAKRGGWPAITLAVLTAIAAPAWANAAKAQKTSANAAATKPAALETLNASTLTEAIGRGALKPASVARAQVLLDRAWFSPGEIDGRSGRNLQRALSAFQMAHDLKVTGKLDAATAKALEQGDTDAVFTTYTVTEKDAAGPYEATPPDMAERAKLAGLGYQSLDEALAERFHVSPALLKTLNGGAKGAARWQAGDTLVVPDVKTKPASEGAAQRIEIDKSDKTLWVLGAQRKVLAVFPISIGGPLDPLEIGTMKIVNEVPNPSFTYNPAVLKTAPKDAQKVEIKPGPNNPVGTMWLGLSKPHWGIHGTPEPSSLGHDETNGCIHLTNWDVERLARLVKPGFEVDVKP